VGNGATPDQRRALEMLAGSPNECTEAIFAALRYLLEIPGHKALEGTMPHGHPAHLRPAPNGVRGRIDVQGKRLRPNVKGDASFIILLLEEHREAVSVNKGIVRSFQEVQAECGNPDVHGQLS
jgi:hypothetical protein